MTKRKTEVPDAVRDYFKRVGRDGGLIGGPRRAAKLSAEQRQAIARKGGLARAKKNKESA